ERWPKLCRIMTPVCFSPPLRLHFHSSELWLCRAIATLSRFVFFISQAPYSLTTGNRHLSRPSSRRKSCLLLVCDQSSFCVELSIIPVLNLILRIQRRIGAIARRIRLAVNGLVKVQTLMTGVRYNLQLN